MWYHSPTSHGGEYNKMKAIVALCVLACVSGTAFLPYRTIIGENCDTSLTGFTVTSLTVSPWPPTKDGDFTVNLAGTFNEAVTLNGCVASIYMSGEELTSMNVPATGSYAAGASYSNSFTEPVPAFMPSGSYEVKMSMMDSNNKPLGCWEVDFTLS